MLPLLNEHRIIIMKIFLRVFFSLTLQSLDEKIDGVTNARYVQPIIMHPILIFEKVKLGDMLS